MPNTLTLTPIAYIKSDFAEKFGIPRQSGLVPELEATVVLSPEYARPEALRGLEDFSHIWLLWGFSKAYGADWSPTVRPPRLGGNTRMGVFATRAPYRPNPIGLSSVRLQRIEYCPDGQIHLHVQGADLLDGTPIYDIKPYIPYTDRHIDATGGFSAAVQDYALQVEIAPELLAVVPPEKRSALRGVLAQDPRPQYQNDPVRTYGMTFADFEIHFRVENEILTVTEIQKREKQ